MNINLFSRQILFENFLSLESLLHMISYSPHVLGGSASSEEHMGWDRNKRHQLLTVLLNGFVPNTQNVSTRAEKTLIAEKLPSSR